MICKNCGTEIADDSVICKNCGFVVKEDYEAKTVCIENPMADQGFEKKDDKKKYIIPIAIVAAIAVFVAGLGFGGAFSKNDAQSTQQPGDDSSISEDAEDNSSDSSDDEIIKPSENRVYVKAKQADIDMLTGQLWTWIFTNQGTFDCETRSMTEVLQKDIFNEFTGLGLYDVFFEEESQQLKLYVNSTSSPDSDHIPEPDPLNKFDEGCDYRKVPAKNVDWVIANVLNVTPSRNFDSNYIYYHDGYYYVQIPMAGDFGIGVTVTLTELSDGRYEIRFDVETGETINMLAGVTEIDGKRIWSFFKF